MGVAVRRCIDFLIILLIPTPLVCISSFLQQQLSYFSVDFKCFSFLFMLFLCNIANIAQRTFKNSSKIEIMWTWRYNYIDKNVRQLRVPRLPCARYQVTFHGSCELTLCMIMASER